MKSRWTYSTFCIQIPVGLNVVLRSATVMSERPFAERVLSLFAMLENHNISPADLLLAVIKDEKSSKVNAHMKRYRDDLYGTLRSSRFSKLSDILEAVTESKKGRKELKSWMRYETAEEIIADIVQGEIDGCEESEEEEDEEEE